jgi:hypothetical protein
VRFLALSIALFLAPFPARAANDLGLEIDGVESVGGAVCASYHVANPLTPQLLETLDKGMPARVVYEVGVWRKRAFWFDRLVVALRSEHRVVFDSPSGRYRVRAGTNPPRAYDVPGLDSLRARIFVQRRLPLLLASELDSAASYFVSVRVLIRPLSPEDLTEVQDWLTGGGEASPGGHRGIPDYLLGLAVSLSGLGDRTALARSGRFKPGLLLTGHPAGPSP